MKEDRVVVSSDDEAEPLFLSVSNYHLEDDNREPVSFSELPIQWGEECESFGAKKEEQVFLHGLTDNGLRKIMVPVTAWRFDLSGVKPAISLLSKDKGWIKLQNPRKSFQGIISTIMITVYFLHSVKKNPKISAKSVWDSMCKDKELSYYESKPSQKDLLDHIPLISAATKRDAVLAKSKLLLTVMEKLWNKKHCYEEVKDVARPASIAGEIDIDLINEANEESEEEDDLFDSACALCDNGGKLLCCDGPCMRSFHATEKDGRESLCESLGLTQKEVDKIQSFYCKNCEYNQHQCFACGKLGSSSKVKGAEVIKCASATCERFYHPHCVAKLLPQVDKHDAMELERNIADGNSFTCPIHYCCICKEVENRTQPELQFALCRRCPKSYHRKCLPREIAFEDINEEDIVTRAWEGLLSNNRVLIYCLNHEIDEELGTPLRDHIKFPDAKATVQETNTTYGNVKPAAKGRAMLNKNNIDLDNSSGKSTANGSKVPGELSSDKVGSKKSKKMISVPNTSWKHKANRTSRPLTENKRSISKKIEISDGEESQPLQSLLNTGSKRMKPTRKQDSALPPLDADLEKRLLALIEEVGSSITLENVLGDHNFASTDTHSLRNFVEKTITMGKLEASVDAIRTALRKLESGCSIQEVEAICGPDVLKQIFKWKDKLNVYLAPILNGNHHTSFGRHFTRVEKLEGIVDKLHWYAQDGDMVVDFCCGANDFSILMKKRLEETGKKCLYQNYDLLPTKNSFSFEMRDWMTVQTNELPTGSKLIMGLNPPFGENEALANKFIDKALEFKPKLLILILPQEAERLDKKQSPYDLVWEDENFLSGMSFYLPGSVDVNDRLIDQWNVKPPILSLWSRPDWTSKHKVIANEHGHVSSQREILQMEAETFPADHTVDASCGDDLTSSPDVLKSTDNQEDESSSGNEGQKRSSHNGIIDQERPEEKEHGMIESSKASRKRKHMDQNERRGHCAVSSGKRQAVNKRLKGAPDLSQPNPLDGRSSVEGFHLNSPVSFPQVEVGGNGYEHSEPISVRIPSNSGIKEGPIDQQHSREKEKYLGGQDPDSTPTLKQSATSQGELNHARMGSSGSEPPMVSRSATVELGDFTNGWVDDFAPGPHHAFSQRNSAGWLDE